MNTGVICFVFNDRTSMYFEDHSKKTVFYFDEKKQLTDFVYDKIQEEGNIKKKLYILEAYTKSIKKFRQKVETEKIVLVTEFLKTNYAAIFLLSNNNIQVDFLVFRFILMIRFLFYSPKIRLASKEKIQINLRAMRILLRIVRYQFEKNMHLLWPVNFITGI